MKDNNLEKIKEVLTRGVENTYPDLESLEKVLLSPKKLKIYHGIDPTGPTLHLGHFVQLLKLKQLQDLGHKIIILFGDFTAQIGDPTDKLAVRQPLTHRQVLLNTRDYKKQIGRVLNLKKTVFKHNSQWLGKLKFKDLIEISSNFTAQQTLARGMFQTRIEQGKDLYLHEFLYPLMQAYDSVAMDVDMEIGGNDQMFNMLAGRTLMRKMKNKEKFVITTKLLEDISGKKMGKTENNMVALNDQPSEMYGKIMSWPDELIMVGFEIATDVSMAEIFQIKKDLDNGENPKKMKMLLAYKIVELNYGTNSAISAEENFRQIFEQNLNPDDIKEFKIKARNIVDVLVETGLAGSKSDARRLVKQGGVKVDTITVIDENFEIKSIDADGVVIQKGKRHFAKLVK